MILEALVAAALQPSLISHGEVVGIIKIEEDHKTFIWCGKPIAAEKFYYRLGYWYANGMRSYAETCEGQS